MKETNKHNEKLPTCLHEAAMGGPLDQIPQELLTKEVLTRADKGGNTCLHEAAMGGPLDQIPQELLTKEVLTRADKGGNTCLHWAASNDQLHKIPKDLIREESLIKGDKHHKNSLNQIPQELATLLQPDRDDQTKLDNDTISKIIEQTREACKEVPTETKVSKKGLSLFEREVKSLGAGVKRTNPDETLRKTLSATLGATIGAVVGGSAFVAPPIGIMAGGIALSGGLMIAALQYMYNECKKAGLLSPRENSLGKTPKRNSQEIPVSS